MSTTEILRTRCQRACGSSHSSQMRAVPRRFVAATRRAVLGGAIVVCALTTTGVLANPCFDEIGQLEEWERRLRLLSERAQQPAAARDYENLCHLDVDAMAAITQFQDALKKMGQCNIQSDAQLIARSRAIHRLPKGFRRALRTSKEVAASPAREMDKVQKMADPFCASGVQGNSEVA